MVGHFENRVIEAVEAYYEESVLSEDTARHLAMLADDKIAQLELSIVAISEALESGDIARAKAICVNPALKWKPING